MDILDLLANDNYIVLNKSLAKEIGIENAIVFGALCSYQRMYKDEEFYREQEKIIEDTCLTEYLVRKSIKELKELELINVVKKGLPAKYYFKINTTSALKILTSSGAKFDTTGDSKNETSIFNINNIYEEKKEINKNNKENNTKEKSTRFQKPTLEELQTYINEKGYHFSAEAFIDYYDSVGWKIGKNPMKDWKAACRTWESKYNNNNKKELSKETSYPDYKDKNYL